MERYFTLNFTLLAFLLEFSIRLKYYAHKMYSNFQIVGVFYLKSYQVNVVERNT